MEHTAAILLRRIPWSETSLIVTWLTESLGTVKTAVRGARQPRSSFAGKLDLFFRAQISVTLSTKSDLHALREVFVEHAFDASAAGTGGVYLAAYFSEVAGIAAPSMAPAPEIFDLLRRGLDHLQKGGANIKALHHFEKQLCQIMGVYDASGTVSATEAIASLYGQALPSREAALRFLS
jgi:DNA repair protein RecO (recombination protein O)